MPEGKGSPGGCSRRFVYRLHFTAAALVGGAIFVLLSLLAAFRIAVLRWDRERVMRTWIPRWWRIMSTILGWEVSVEGEGLFDASRPAVIVVNHQSSLDIVLWARFFPPRTVVVGKKQIRKIPVWGYIFTGTGNILIDRENAERARQSLAEAARRIHAERLNVWMAPEGHRNLGEEMLPFKKGAFHLAAAARVPVLPVLVGPVWTVFDARRWMLRPGRVHVKVLAPIPTEDLTEADIDPLLQRVRAAMVAARLELIASAGERIG
jgi:1-acyl-sn-glycerol-3-phosphate acyltransferase